MPSELFQKQVGMVATYAHRDIAYHFGMWISPRFQLLLVKEYQRLKAEEQKIIGWTAKRIWLSFMWLRQDS